MGNAPGKLDCADTSGKEGSPASNEEREIAVFYAGKRAEEFLWLKSLHDEDELIRAQSDEYPGTHDKRYPTVFNYPGEGEEVYISGTFTDWKPIPMVRSEDKLFSIIEYIPEGDHQYRFKVDGQWHHNPNAPAVDNEIGTMNNVISIKESDYLDFEALDNMGFESKGSPAGSYSQIFPKYTRKEKLERPPTCPPQYVKLKDISSSSQTTLLPEYPHVTVKHVYVLPIKDNILSLRVTNRFIANFFTVIFYKPIQRT